MTDQPARTLTPNEHDRAWHAIEGGVGEDGADPGTVLAAVLHALNIKAPSVEDEQAASPRLRDAARTASGQQPETTVCAHCGLDVENRGEPSMDGNHHVLWVHVPGGTLCDPQQAAHSTRATPAVGQPAAPADRTAETEARDTDVTWSVVFITDSGDAWQE